MNISHEPTPETREKAKKLSGYGVPQEQIAAVIGISDDTLRKYYAPELLEGKAEANAVVGGSLFAKAAGGDTAAAIWWSKAQMRWKDQPQQVEHSGPDGKGIELNGRFEIVLVKPKENAG